MFLRVRVSVRLHALINELECLLGRLVFCGYIRATRSCVCSFLYMQGLWLCARERVRLLYVSEIKDKRRPSACLPAARMIDVEQNTQTAEEELLTRERQTRWLALPFIWTSEMSRQFRTDGFIYLILVISLRRDFLIARLSSSEANCDAFSNACISERMFYLSV